MFMRRILESNRIVFVIAAVLATAAAGAQQTATGPQATAAASDEDRGVSPRHAAAQAAGYRALHLCTATFSSGLPKDLIDRTGSGQSAAKQPTVIDEQNK